MNKEQFETITKWQKETFGQATPFSKLSHLKQELSELWMDLEKQSDNRKLEFADCFILLFGAAASDGMSYEDVCNAIDEKMKINYNRSWGQPDKNGVVNHIKDKAILHMYLSRAQAKIALRHGEKVSHQYFLDNEFIVFDATENILINQDGIRMDWKQFWDIRNDEKFNENWMVIEKKNIYENIHTTNIFSHSSYICFTYNSLLS